MIMLTRHAGLIPGCDAQVCVSDAVYIVVHIACKHNVPASRVLTSMTIMESEWIVGLPLTLK